MKTGQYDVVSASGDASLRLIASRRRRAGQHRPGAELRRRLRRPEAQAVELASTASPYGIPHGRGANLLMYNTDVVKPGPDLVGRGVRRRLAVQGQGHGVRLADLHRRRGAVPDEDQARPGHQEPLRPRRQAVRRRRRPAQGAERQHRRVLGGLPQGGQQAFKTGDTVVGTTWQVIANLAQADKAPVEAVLPDRGRDRLVGHLDGRRPRAKHPNCAYLWMNYIISPKVNAEVAEWFGEAPSNSKACAETSDKSFCDTYHAADEAYFDQVWYWTTPIAQCLDGRTDVTCKDYGDWTTGLDRRSRADRVARGREDGDRGPARLQRAAPAPVPAAGAAAGTAAAVARRGLPRRARRPAALRRSGPPTPSPATSCARSRSTTSAPSAATTSTGPSRCAPSAWRPRSR